MSFRRGLTLFFVAIVIVPMASLAFVLFRLIDDNESGKADARIAARQEAAINLFAEARTRASRVADDIGADRRLAAALQRGDEAAARRRARQLLRSTPAVRILVRDRSGIVFDVGPRAAVAPAARRLVRSDGSPFGTLVVSARSAGAYARRAARVGEVDVVVTAGGRTLASTLSPAPPRLPAAGEAQIGGEDVRVASFVADGFRDQQQRVTVLADQAQVAEDLGDARLLTGLLLGGFFLLAFAFALLVSRSLQRQIGAFLEAARQLGRGDFSAQVPTAGRDEFAALGRQFNDMARQLEARIEDLRHERTRLREALQRTGQTFAANLDRDALLRLAVSTIVDGLAAEGARATLLDGPLRAPREVARAGEPAALEDAVRDAEERALAGAAPADAVVPEGAALARPLRESESGEVLALLSVWRTGGPFGDDDRDLFAYLAGQAGVSLENLALHDAVRRQAVTDELTGLANHRRFQDALSGELERSRRFEQPLGLVLLDIDDFKSVNDLYGHQVGDLVLAEVGRVLRQESREIDVPARYGGEELVVVLPGTDLEGAYQHAERVREGICRIEVPLPGDDAPLRVTASFGAASVPESATDARSLVEAADTALYRAKRAGKNRAERAVPVPAE